MCIRDSPTHRVKSQILKHNIVFELVALICTELDTVTSHYPEVLTALTLFITLLVKVSSDESPFIILSGCKGISEIQLERKESVIWDC